MENLAHTLCGLRVADLGWRERVGPRAPWIGAVAANLPDSDLVIAMVDRDMYLWWHRGITHSFLGWPFLALAGAAASRRWTGQGRYEDHLMLWGAGLLSHALLDWPTTWGTMLWYPLTDTRFSLDWIFIVDPMFWVLLWAVPRWLRPRHGPRTAATWSLLLLAGWVLFCGSMRQQATRQVEGHARLFPGPLAPVNWTGVRHDDGDALTRWWCTPWSAEPGGSFREPTGPEVDAVRATYAGDRYFWMSRAPALRAVARNPDGVEVTLSDLAYTSAWAPDDFRFTTVFTLDEAGALVDMER